MGTSEMINVRIYSTATVEFYISFIFLLFHVVDKLDCIAIQI